MIIPFYWPDNASNSSNHLQSADLIKTQDMHSLFMVQFVAIYALFGGTNQAKNLWLGDYNSLWLHIMNHK